MPGWGARLQSGAACFLQVCIPGPPPVSSLQCPGHRWPGAMTRPAGLELGAGWAPLLLPGAHRGTRTGSVTSPGGFLFCQEVAVAGHPRQRSGGRWLTSAWSHHGSCLACFLRCTWRAAVEPRFSGSSEGRGVSGPAKGPSLGFHDAPPLGCPPPSLPCPLSILGPTFKRHRLSRLARDPLPTVSGDHRSIPGCRIGDCCPPHTSGSVASVAAGGRMPPFPLYPIDGGRWRWGESQEGWSPGAGEGGGLSWVRPLLSPWSNCCSHPWTGE